MQEVFVVSSEFTNTKANFSFNSKKFKTIELKDVDYQYDHTQQILSKINLKIQAGEKISIVGKSDSNKTSLLKLIINFYQPGSGEIMLDGIDIQQTDKKILRRKIQYLPQKPYIFSGTILKNLTFEASEETTQEEIFQAVELTQIREDIEHSPLNFQTKLSAEETALSLGQMQRIAIARSLLTKVSVLIFDESTSSLDVLTEQKILEKLLALPKKTLIFVAHRLNIAKSAQDGKIKGRNYTKKANF
ncbi:MAG: ATP-binding cassette domain-containing protein [Streptococcaceae bacterium]|nr:ATP-binding cassette domain-containing protein [Streptococcaceae bacterium]